METGEQKAKTKYFAPSGSWYRGSEITNAQVIRSMWLRFYILTFGALISLPWVVSLVPRIPGLFDMWMVGTDQETPTSTMTLPQVVLVVSVLLDAVVPLVCLVTIFYQGFKFVTLHDVEALVLMAHALWIKTAAPLLVGLALMMIASPGGTWNSPDLWAILTYPEMGFWLYSPILALVVLVIARREQSLLLAEGAKVTAN